MNSAVAVVPAAGRSRRMGRPKLLLPFRGSTVVGSLVAALRGGGVGEVVLVVASSRGALARWGRTAGLTVAINPDPDGGMLSSVLAGIAALGGGEDLAAREAPLLVAPGDLPTLRPETVGQLLRRCRGALEPLVVPVHRGRGGHPLLIAPRLIAEIASLDPAIGLRQLAYRHRQEVLRVEVDDPGVVHDIDTPADYRQAARDPG